MKKVILFARVSTQHQNLQRQKELLLPLIKEDGYNEDDIAYIEHKESAIKNDIQNRKSLQEMIELIETESIEAVYVTEISRLGRRNDVLYEVFALLAKERIALVVQSPTLIRTINKDGTDNPMGQVVISFMQHLAVSEMNVKIERCKSGIELRRKNGHLTASTVKFGYKRSADNKPIIDEEDAELVRKIFKMCLEGDSCGVIFKKMKQIARWNNSPHNNKIGNILKDPTYIGENPHYQYPSIIDEETFKKAGEMLSSKYTLTYKTKFSYYCQKLIHWNGRVLTPRLQDGTYALWDGNKRNGINVDCIDGVTKQLAIEAYVILAEEDENKKRASFIEAKKTAEKKIVGINKEIEELSSKLDKLNELYIDGKIDKSNYDFKYGKFEGERGFLIKEKDKLNVTIGTANQALTNKKDKMWATTTYLNLDDLTDDDEIINIIKQTIQSIDLEKIDNGWIIRYTYKDIAYNEQRKETYYKYLKPTPKIINLYECIEGIDAVNDWTGCWHKRLLNFKKDRGIKKKR